MEGGVSFFLFDGSMYVLVMVVVDVVLMAVWTSGWLGGSTASTLSVVAVTHSSLGPERSRSELM